MNTLQQFNKFVNKNSPSILTGLGVAGLFTTVAMAIYATPRALERIQIEEERRWDEADIPDGDSIAPMTPVEILQVTWKEYIPTAIMLAATATCIIGSNSVNMRRNSALAAIYSLSETAAREYKSKVKKTVGAKKEQEISDDLDQDRLNNHPVDSRYIIPSGNGDFLCYDSLSGRYFRSTVEKLRKIENDYNKRLLSEMYLSLNDLYSEMNLENINLGEDMGWVVDKEMLEFNITTKVASTGEPCLVIGYRTVPIHI